MGLAGLPGLLDKQLDGAADTLRRACAGKDWVLTPDDAAYPQRLREIAGPPLALFCRGDAPTGRSAPPSDWWAPGGPRTAESGTPPVWRRDWPQAA